MDESILTSIKKMLGIAEDYEHFDLDIIMHINAAFMVLNQLGVGRTYSFSIVDKNSKWIDFSEDIDLLNVVQPYVYLNVKLMFDPPTNSFVLNAMQDRLNEYTWRLNVEAEGVNPNE